MIQKLLGTLYDRGITTHDCFFDIGAHAGYFSLLYTTLCGEQVYVLFAEPSGNIHLLQVNYKLSPQIDTIHVAISNQKEILTFFEFQEMYAEYNTLHPEQFNGQVWVQHYPLK